MKVRSSAVTPPVRYVSGGVEEAQDSALMDAGPLTTEATAEAEEGSSMRPPTVPTAATSTTGITLAPDSPIETPMLPAGEPPANRVNCTGPSSIETLVS
jgi:hypothetical protein